MATTKKKTTAKKAPSKFDIITMYMEYVLEHEMYPKSIYKFCKANKITETDFYAHFGNIDGLKKEIWIILFDKTMEVAHANEAYDQFTSREKMLTFFYSFFEMLTLNRSYILFALSEHDRALKNMEQLKGLRKQIKSFASELIAEDNEDKQFKITKNPTSLFSEGAWIQFLFLLKFWMDDASAGFEKTDVAIEKSVNTIFDVFDNTPLTNILDLGKFLWKERTM
ncbi:TetR family transcriptional regulator C-terminal domain-containing protein [Aquimarina intermedia]|uniref:AcrR family transcriptional regulator n=1 Tax=Aquimarina intermedia TaxID=350814 RepID=A0A5S5C0K4_9FLAO|nr:TetR family transcriptional regulator C-terminal domain-containing protein [Aquimarina intermedia]TYP72951.1 AcrR family transcriptional regulator [Aquimarina intermedia]